MHSTHERNIEFLYAQDIKVSQLWTLNVQEKVTQ